MILPVTFLTRTSFRRSHNQPTEHQIATRNAGERDGCSIHQIAARFSKMHDKCTTKEASEEWGRTRMTRREHGSIATYSVSFRENIRVPQSPITASEESLDATGSHPCHPPALRRSDGPCLARRQSYPQ